MVSSKDGKNMEKIKEDYIKTANDNDSFHWIQSYMNQYPTEKGFRVEFFVSPKFIRVTVYKMGVL